VSAGYTPKPARPARETARRTRRGLRRHGEPSTVHRPRLRREARRDGVEPERAAHRHDHIRLTERAARWNHSAGTLGRRRPMTSEPRLLLVNTGSSSVKLTVWEQGRALSSQRFARDAVIDLADVVEPHGPIDAVAHRVVHAGEIQRHAFITPRSRRRSATRASSRRCTTRWPCATSPRASGLWSRGASGRRARHRLLRRLARARSDLRAAPGVGPVRRYGFHGLAHAFMGRRCVELDPSRPRRLVTLQLGAGCSATAIMDGRALDTSMASRPPKG